MDDEKLAMQRRIDTLDQHAIRLHAALTEYERENARLKAELETVKRERDAAVRDIPRACGYCKHYAHRKTHECHSKKPCANISGVNTAWEWRGLCESNGGIE